MPSRQSLLPREAANIVTLTPEIAANVARVIFDEDRRDDHVLIRFIQAHTVVYEAPDFTEIRTHDQWSAERLAKQGVNGERAVANWFAALAEALHDWVDAEEKRRREVENRAKEKRAAELAKNKKRKAAAKKPAGKVDNDTDAEDQEDQEDQE